MGHSFVEEIGCGSLSSDYRSLLQCGANAAGQLLGIAVRPEIDKKQSRLLIQHVAVIGCHLDVGGSRPLARATREIDSRDSTLSANRPADAARACQNDFGSLLDLSWTCKCASQNAKRDTWACRLMGRSRGPQLHSISQSQIGSDAFSSL